MVQLLKKPQVKVVTKDGECEINITLDLNINLNTGNIKVSAESASEEADSEETKFMVPDFKPGKKIKFGERVKG
jgi:hypothetical protein